MLMQGNQARLHIMNLQIRLTPLEEVFLRIVNMADA